MKLPESNKAPHNRGCGELVATVLLLIVALIWIAS